MSEVDHQYRCPFCKSLGRFVYKMGDYNIYQCIYCGSGGVSPLPTISELEEFYNGFLFRADIQNYPKVMTSAKILYGDLNLEFRRDLKMLDVGGGGGFYSKAFQELGYGRSTYVDLDPKACEFAQRELDIDTVTNDDVLNLDPTEKFDFIMCRHLIEHLLDPLALIDKIINCIAPGGTLLLVFPNGQSLEYLAYTDKGLTKRIMQIQKGQGSSGPGILWSFLTGKILHGIDPPRHLWAITKRGIEHFLKSKGIDYHIATYPLTDPAYSPYFTPARPYEKIQCLFGNSITSKVFGGTHLAVTIRNKQKR